MTFGGDGEAVYDRRVGPVTTLIRSGIRIGPTGEGREAAQARAGTIRRLGRLLRPLQTVLAGRVPEVALGYGAFALINTFGMPAGLNSSRRKQSPKIRIKSGRLRLEGSINESRHKLVPSARTSSRTTNTLSATIRTAPCPLTAPAVEILGSPCRHEPDVTPQRIGSISSPLHRNRRRTVLVEQRHGA